MGLIKSTIAPPTAVRFSMADIETQARGMLLRAKMQAEELLVEAQREGEELKNIARAQGAEQGHREGFAKGLEDGKKAGHQQALNENRAQMTNLIKAMTAAVADLNTHHLELKSEAVTEVVELAIAIARRVTKKVGAMDEHVVVANVVEAMKLVVHSKDVRIAVHPQQRATLLAELPNLQMKWPGVEHVELMEDAALSPGGCRIFTKNGEIDADLDVQLDHVVRDLLPSSEVKA